MSYNHRIRQLLAATHRTTTMSSVSESEFISLFKSNLVPAYVIRALLSIFSSVVETKDHDSRFFNMGFVRLL